MTSDVFGSGGGEALARELGVPLLGQVGLDAALRESGDAGVPLVVSDPSHDVARAIAAVAATIDESRVGGFTRTLPLVS
jgi:ATP-binding protein involved in chromosome partitioning